MPHFSLSAVGADRPGIVAAVSGALVALGGNLEDSTMTILQGHFAILLVVSTDDDVTAADLEAALAPVAQRFDLTVAVRPIDLAPELSGSEASVEPWTISVHGTDRTGLVHGVTSALAEEGGNVVDLATHLVGTADAPVYVMTLRVTLPAAPDAAAAAERIRLATESLGVRCTVHRDESETL
ncbi:MAG: glycine cleavage system transcriptional repressor [Acidimicrobiales bacterium]